MSEYLVGFSERIITPPAGVEMAGYANRAGPAEGVHDELKAIAAVFDDRSGQKSVLCAVDVCSLPRAVTDAVRNRAAMRMAARPERILLAATHTHSGPMLTSDHPLNQQCRRTLEDLLVAAILEADLSRRPARVGVSVGSVEGIGGNRRDPLHGPADRAVRVLRVDDVRTGRIMGVVVHHACHATTLDLSNLLLSADYPGVLRDTVREALEDHPCVLFLNGACGDVNPGGYSAEDSALGKTIPNRTFRRAEEIGVAIGAEAVRCVEAAPMEDTFRLQGGALNVTLPMRRFPLPSEARRLAAEADVRLEAARAKGLSGAAWDRLRLEALYAHSDVAFAQRFWDTPGGDWPIELQGLAIGASLFLALPGEVFTDIGLRLQTESPFDHTFVVGYANAGSGYFPTVDALAGGGYEVKESMFGETAIRKLEGWAALLARGLHRSQAAAETAAVEPPGPGSVQARENPMLRQPLHDVRRARFPAIDAHMHTAGAWRTAEEKLATMAAANVRYVVDMFGDLMLDADFTPSQAFADEERGRILHFTGVDFRRIDDADWPDYVREKIRKDKSRGARGVKLFKEVGLVYRDHAGSLILPDDPRLAAIWGAAAAEELPVLYHVADPIRNFAPIEGTYDDLRALDEFSLRWRFGAPGYPTHDQLMACQERLVAGHPETTFILAHLAGLDSDLARLGGWLERYPNVVVDTSARLYELGSQPHTAREFFLAFPDRILWGTDVAWPDRDGMYGYWFRFLETFDEGFASTSHGKTRFIHGIGLPDDVLRRVYGANAARVLGIDPERMV